MYVVSSRSLDTAESPTVPAPCWVLLSVDLPYAAYPAEVVGGRGRRGNGWDPRHCCAPQAGIVRLRLQGKKMSSARRAPVTSVRQNCRREMGATAVQTYLAADTAATKRDWHALIGIWHDHCASQSCLFCHVRDVLRMIMIDTSTRSRRCSLHSYGKDTTRQSWCHATYR